MVVAGCCVGKSLKMLVPFVLSMQAELGRVVSEWDMEGNIVHHWWQYMPLKFPAMAAKFNSLKWQIMNICLNNAVAEHSNVCRCLTIQFCQARSRGYLGAGNCRGHKGLFVVLVYISRGCKYVM